MQHYIHVVLTLFNMVFQEQELTGPITGCFSRR